MSGSSAGVMSVGDLLAGQYELLESLGRGSAAEVFRARDRLLDAECAVKILRADRFGDERGVERFVEEARICLGLSHPNIVRARHLGRDGTRLFLTMELLQGRTLRALMKEARATGAPIPIATASAILLQVLAALDYAHRNTVHRDIKPENIFICGEGTDAVVKVLDFGVAKALGDTAGRGSIPVGTAWYVAPEQAAGDPAADQRADLYSIAAVAYEFLTARPPAGRLDKPSSLRAELHDSWDEWILGGMESDPDRRPSSADEMAASLRRIPIEREVASSERPIEDSAGAPVVAAPYVAPSGGLELGMVPSAQQGRDLDRPRSRWRLPVVAVAIALLAAGAWLLWPLRPPGRESPEGVRQTDLVAQIEGLGPGEAFFVVELLFNREGRDTPSQAIPQVAIGERIHFRLTTHRAGFAHLLVLDPDGSLDFLGTSQGEFAHRVAQGEAALLPTNTEVAIDRPVGREIVLALVSSSPLDIAGIQKIGRLEGPAAMLTALREEAARKGPWASSVVRFDIVSATRP